MSAHNEPFSTVIRWKAKGDYLACVVAVLERQSPYRETYRFLVMQGDGTQNNTQHVKREQVGSREYCIACFDWFDLEAEASFEPSDKWRTHESAPANNPPSLVNGYEVIASWPCAAVGALRRGRVILVDRGPVETGQRYVTAWHGWERTSNAWDASWHQGEYLNCSRAEAMRRWKERVQSTSGTGC